MIRGDILDVLVTLTIVLTVVSVNACKVLQNGGPVDAVLTKKSPSEVPICLILNGRYLFSTQVKFDVYSRIVLPGSFEAVRATGACAQPNSIWFPLGCAWTKGTYGEGIGLGAPTNYYVSVQGISSSYRKRYAYVSSTGPPTTAPTNAAAVVGVFPITTLVISVRNGVVVEVFWDDNCFFNYNRKPGTSTGADQMVCSFNAYQIDNAYTSLTNTTFNSWLNQKGSQFNGYDTYITNSACLVNNWKDPLSTSTTPVTPKSLPSGFCDLGVYITWVGTSADGQQLGSASPRYKRFRQYAMDAEYPTVSLTRDESECLRDIRLLLKWILTTLYRCG